MKKFVTVLLVAILAIGCVFALAACKKDEPKVDESKILEDKAHPTYLVAGGAIGWDNGQTDPTDASFDNRRMTATNIGNEKLASVKSQLTDAKYLYIAEIEFDFANLLEYGDDKTAADAHDKGGWLNNANEDGGTLIDPKDGNGARYFDGNATIKIFVPIQGDLDVWTNDGNNYRPSKESGAVKSLTPKTLYAPPLTDEETYEHSGTANNNPVLLGDPGKYLIIFVEYNDGSYGLGAIRLGDLTPAA